MVVCRYYLQGNCKFGDRCRYEHPPGLEGSASRQRSGPAPSGSHDRGGVLFQHQGGHMQDAMVDQTPRSGNVAFGGFGGATGTALPDASTATPFGAVSAGPSLGQRSAAKEAASTGRGTGNRKSLWAWWLEGHQAGVWPLSCYGNTYAKNALRGIDTSFEELRADAYAAVQLQGASLEQVEAQEASRVQQALETAQQVLQRQTDRPTPRSMQNVSMSTSSGQTLPFAPNPSLAATHSSGQLRNTDSGVALSGTIMMPFSPAMPAPMPEAGFSFPDGRTPASSTPPYMPMGGMYPSPPSVSDATNSAASSFPYATEGGWPQPTASTTAVSGGFANHAYHTAAATSTAPGHPQASAASLNGTASAQGSQPVPEQLTEGAMKAYQSQHFTKGSVPETPPPSHLC